MGSLHSQARTWAVPRNACVAGRVFPSTMTDLLFEGRAAMRFIVTSNTTCPRCKSRRFFSFELNAESASAAKQKFQTTTATAAAAHCLESKSNSISSPLSKSRRDYTVDKICVDRGSAAISASS
jgi:hypothetical protein